jgi:hypothetical protein
MMRIASLCILALAGVAGYIQIDSRLPWAPFAIPAVLESELPVAESAPVAVGKKRQRLRQSAFLSRVPNLFQRLRRHPCTQAQRFY